MKLIRELNSLLEVMIINTDTADAHEKQSIETDKYYVYIELFTKTLLIGPFENRDAASQYMNSDRKSVV